MAVNFPTCLMCSPRILINSMCSFRSCSYCSANRRTCSDSRSTCRLSASRSLRAAAFRRSTALARWTVSDASPRSVLYRSGPRWTFGGSARPPAPGLPPDSLPPASRPSCGDRSAPPGPPAPAPGSLLSPTPRGSCPTSHQPWPPATSAPPPRPGALPLYRRNHCSLLRSIPSFARSEYIRWQCGFSPPPRCIASV